MEELGRLQSMGQKESDRTECTHTENYTHTHKYFNDPDNYDGVVIHLETDILECEVKWVLASLQTQLEEVMEFQLSYFKF